MIKLDEQALRRPEFEEGYRVVLADGQSWCVPPVKVRFFPGDDGTLRMRAWHGPDIEDDLDILFGVADAPADMALPFVQIPLKIAATLLRRNYDLPPRAAGNLLSWVPDDPASEERLQKVTKAILGRDPDAADEDDESPEGDDPKGEDAGDGGTPTGAGS